MLMPVPDKVIEGATGDTARSKYPKLSDEERVVLHLNSARNRSEAAVISSGAPN
jgi:hypothetical protein